MGYEHTKADHAIFTYSGLSFFTITLYIDDITMVSKDLEIIQKDKEDLRRSYDMTDLKELNWILGICIVCDQEVGTIILSQDKFAVEVLERFGKESL
jgi:reverse transcriptase-like protein